MTVIGGSTHGMQVPTASSVPSSVSWLSRVNAYVDTSLDNFASFLLRCLCRASRGYLCPPDMTSIMYPDEAQPPVSRFRECCDEKLPRK